MEEKFESGAITITNNGTKLVAISLDFGQQGNVARLEPNQSFVVYGHPEKIQLTVSQD